MRRAARTDSNHSRIIAALREIGCSVLDLSRVGGGCPDIAWGWRNRSGLIEIKRDDVPPSKSALNEAQEKFALHWRGCYGIARNEQDAIDIVTEATS